MKLLRRDTDAALKALVLIAQSHGKPQDSSVLARQMKVSRPFLRRVLQILQKGGFLRSVKGRGGGFWLSQPPAAVKVLAVIEKFQGKVELQECLFRSVLCPDLKTCVLRLKLLELESGLIAQLKDLTLADLLALSGASVSAPEKETQEIHEIKEGKHER